MKPYDVDQAVKDVNSSARRVLEQAGAAIEGARLEAVRSLEVQARAFADMPRDLATLFKGATYVAIEEIVPDRGVLDFHGIDLRTSGGPRTIYPRGFPGEKVELPAKKHRVIVFFIPVDEPTS